MKEVFFIYPPSNRRVGSVNMRVRQVFGALKLAGSASYTLSGIREENRVRPWSVGCHYIWVKPKNWLALHLASVRNRVIIDVLDSDLSDFPRWISRSQNIEFIVCTGKQRDLLQKFFPNKIHVIVHHFDPAINHVKWDDLDYIDNVGYVGSVLKFVKPLGLDVDFVSWEEFIENPRRHVFHWAVRGRSSLFEPETKVATAAAVGAIPIVSANELGTLLPYSYPFFVDDHESWEEIEGLLLKMRDEELVSFWRGYMAHLKQRCALESAVNVYEEILGGQSL